MITPYEGYVEVCEQLNRLTPGEHAKKRSMLVNSGAEAVENAVKIARAATGRPAVVVFEHAYHGRTLLTMTLTAKYRPYKAGFGPFAPEVYRAPMAYPFRWPGGPDRRAGRARRRSTWSPPRSAPTRWPAWWSSRSRARAGSWCRRRASCPGRGLLRRATASCWSPTRCRPASAAPATGSPRARGHGAGPGHHGQGHRRRAAAGRGDRAGRADGRGARLRPGRHLRRQPGGLRRGARGDRHDRGEDLVGRARRIGELALPRLRALAERYPAIGDVRGRGAMLAVELVRPGTTGRPTRRCWRTWCGGARPRAWSC